MEWQNVYGRYESIEYFGAATGTSTISTIDVADDDGPKDLYSILASPVAYDSHGFYLFFGDSNADYITDILTTSGTTAGLLVSNFYVSSPTLSCAYFPVFIPANTTLFSLAVGSQANPVVEEAQIGFVRKDFNDLDIYSRVTTYGIDEATSGATLVDAGAAANTWSGWVTLTSGTAYPIEAFLLSLGDNDNVTQTAGNYFFEIGIGEVGQEIGIFRAAVMVSSNEDGFLPNIIGPVPMSIPQGSRIAVRSMSTVTDATDRVSSIAFYGFD